MKAQDKIVQLYEDIVKMDWGAMGRRVSRVVKSYSTWDTANHGSVDAVCNEMFLQHKFLKREAISRYTPSDPKSLCGRITKVLVYGCGSIYKWSWQPWTVCILTMVNDCFKSIGLSEMLSVVSLRVSDSILFVQPTHQCLLHHPTRTAQ